MQKTRIDHGSFGRTRHGRRTGVKSSCEEMTGKLFQVGRGISVLVFREMFNNLGTMGIL